MSRLKVAHLRGQLCIAETALQLAEAEHAADANYVRDVEATAQLIGGDVAHEQSGGRLISPSSPEARELMKRIVLEQAAVVMVAVPTSPKSTILTFNDIPSYDDQPSTYDTDADKPPTSVSVRRASILKRKGNENSENGVALSSSSELPSPAISSSSSSTPSCSSPPSLECEFKCITDYQFVDGEHWVTIEWDDGKIWSYQAKDLFDEGMENEFIKQFIMDIEEEQKEQTQQQSHPRHKKKRQS